MQTATRNFDANQNSQRIQAAEKVHGEWREEQRAAEKAQETTETRWIESRMKAGLEAEGVKPEDLKEATKREIRAKLKDSYRDEDEDYRPATKTKTNLRIRIILKRAGLVK
ncbi:hypothetical protein UFOVP1492_32 [uncultured Caudovirales phage]|uniref:Uncharacterized protein n=1 Tax=uncultured Caudovirales phage TaxID=2100421 RepID=A0A6J5SPR7_9CAUD|nr:hypothetical protein UFOVP1127_102 [uncultured Caudovirales phage]CAB4193584.1 hypothetical protein UFOVP1242_108 [uncultured Caudovirales phage]CAB4217458.1 hypothetical protein UFOVP1492_32 [uncultured Caudovirales phage]CAB5231335.1 hypothetical protein UFOVP1580_61 [uncultured Caudovirales phage]